VTSFAKATVRVTLDSNWSEIVQNLQVDISSHCNARCGACVRNVDGDMTKPELVLEHFSQEVWHRLVTSDTRGWFIRELTLNGNWGDPMMHPKLVEMVELYTHYHPESSVYLHTNGSMRSAKFWEDLGRSVRKSTNHLVVFALDGLEDTHKVYRRKTDWNKIVANIKSFTSTGGRANVTMTLFEHNKHQIDEVSKIADECGALYFTLRHSHGDHITVITENEAEYDINACYDIEEFQTGFDNDDQRMSDLRDHHLFIKAQDISQENELDSKCPWYNDRNIQIDPWGKVWPCCHVSLYGTYIENHTLDDEVDQSFLRARIMNDLNHHTLTEVLDNEWFTETLRDAIEDASWSQCRKICGIEK